MLQVFLQMKRNTEDEEELVKGNGTFCYKFSIQQKEGEENMNVVK